MKVWENVLSNALLKMAHEGKIEIIDEGKAIKLTEKGYAWLKEEEDKRKDK